MTVMKIEEYIPLAPHTTFGIGGSARYFCTAENEDDIRECIAFAKEKNIPLFVLGGGSNILVSDDGFPGLVMENRIRGFEHREAEGGVVARAGAGIVIEKDEQQLAKALLSIFRDDSSARLMGMKGREVVEREFAPEAVANSFLKAYQSIL